MKCPVDGSPLEKRVIGRVIIDECFDCRGLWFNAGELRKVRDAADPDIRWLDLELNKSADTAEAAWSERECPQCGKQMATIAYRSTGVKVDYCPDDHGIWLDQGELKAIIEALESEASSKHVDEYVRASLKEALELFTGNEGFISEWKDLLAVTRLLQYRLLVEHPKLTELLVALHISNPLK